MSDLHSIKYRDSKSLLLLNQCGKLKQLYVPFKVKCISQVEKISPGTWVYVNQVSEHPDHLILYKVFNTWVPYNYFQIIINF